MMNLIVGLIFLYMIYLIDRGFRIKRALNILVYQCKYPGICNECFCLGCNVKVNYNDNDNDNDNDNVNDNDTDIDNDNDKVNYSNNVNDNVNDNFIYQGTCLVSHEQSSFADLFGEKHQKGKPNNNIPTNIISVNIKEDLKSWSNDDDIITEATFPDNFRCIISGPSECGKTFLLKN